MNDGGIAWSIGVKRREGSGSSQHSIERIQCSSLKSVGRIDYCARVKGRKWGWTDEKRSMEGPGRLVDGGTTTQASLCTVKTN